MTLGDKVKTLRKENKMTQEQLGEKMGVGKNAVCKWEKNRVVVPTKQLMALSKLFDISIQYFFEGIDE